MGHCDRVPGILARPLFGGHAPSRVTVARNEFIHSFGFDFLTAGYVTRETDEQTAAHN